MWKTIGHNRQKQELENNLQADSLAHAYLFSGPAHIGKFTLAKEFAAKILCKNNGCGTCTDCRQIQSLMHPDYLVLDQLYIEKVNENWEEIAKSSNVPQDHRAKAPKAKTNKIGIQDIQELQKRLQEKAFGKHKVCIIRGIDRITTEATNAFLKIVEEPPKGVIFIFTTSKESQVLPTLLSRLRVLYFHFVHDDIIVEALGEADNKQEILDYAQGRVGVALHLKKDHQALVDLREEYQKIQEIFEQSSLLKQFQFVEQIVETPLEISQFFHAATFYLRSKLSVDKPCIVNCLESLERSEKLISQNVNKKLVLENFFLEVSGICRKG